MFIYTVTSVFCVLSIIVSYSLYAGGGENNAQSMNVEK